MAEHGAGGVNRSPPETPMPTKGESDEEEDELFHFEPEIRFHDDEPPEPKKTESEASVHGGNAFAALVGVPQREGGAMAMQGGAPLISARPSKRRLSRRSFMLHVIAEDE